VYNYKKKLNRRKMAGGREDERQGMNCMHEVLVILLSK
jgi:hypothetical protein